MPQHYASRISQLHRRILRWLALDAQHGRRRRGEGNHADLVRALPHDKGNISHSLRTLEAHDYVTVTRSASGVAQSVSLRPKGKKEGTFLVQYGCEYGQQPEIAYQRSPTPYG